MKLQLVEGTNPILHEACEATTVAKGLQIGRELIKFLNEHNKSHYPGIGLSAPQVGINKRVCVLLFKPTLVLINPEIVDFSEKKIPFEEMCLSFPGKRVNTYRSIWITIRADNLQGTKTFGPTNPEDWNVKNIFRSVAVQHEIDHCFGVLIFSRTNP